MPVENATRIHQLAPASPSGADPISEGAGHIRTVKAAIQGSFPGFGVAADSGLVTLGADAINALPAAVTDAQDSADAAAGAIAGKADRVGVQLRNANTALNTDYANDIVYSDNGTDYSYTLDDSLAIGDQILVQNRGSAAKNISIVTGVNVLHTLMGNGAAPLTGNRTISRGGAMLISKIAAGVFHGLGSGIA